MNTFKSFAEKSATRVAAAALVLGLGACSDDMSVSGSTSLASNIANDVNGLVGDVSAGADAGTAGDSSADAGMSPDAGTDTPEDIQKTPDAEQKPDATPDAEPDVQVQEDVQPDVQADEIAGEDAVTEDSATEDVTADAAAVDAVVENDVPLSNDVSAATDTLVTKTAFCAQTITDQCLKQFQSVMCADACATTDVQVENDIQAKVDELVTGFDKVVSALSQAPKSSIWIGKDYEIVDGNVTWRVTIKNALMDTLHIEYTLQKTVDNGNSEKLTWLVKNLTLEPERLDLRTDIQIPCSTVGYETVDIQPSNQPSVQKEFTAKIEGVPLADEDCVNFDNVIYNIENVCTDANKSVFTGENCTTSNDSYNNNAQIDWFSTDWENDSQSSKPAYKAFLVKGLNQFHAALQKHGMDITN